MRRAAAAAVATIDHCRTFYSGTRDLVFWSERGVGAGAYTASAVRMAGISPAVSRGDRTATSTARLISAELMLRRDTHTLIAQTAKAQSLRSPRRALSPFSTTSKSQAEKGRFDRSAYWRDRIAAQERSGIPVARFCKAHRLTEQAFYYWRKRLRNEQPVRFALVQAGGVDVSPAADRTWN